jgi:CBS domain containing-hemolysin-like protein
MPPGGRQGSFHRRHVTIDLILFVIALFFSAFFSGSETAMISVRRIKLEVWMRQGVKGAQQAYRFLEYPERFLSTTLVGNNIAVVAASSIMAIVLEQFLSGFVITIITSTALLFFGEILPKSMARDTATTFALYSTFVLRFFYILFYPIIWLVMKISQWLLNIFGLSESNVKRFFTRKDLEMLVKEGEQAGFVNQDQRGLISRLILRGEQKAREVMIPRTEMTAVKVNTRISEVSRIFLKTGYSRLPVVGKTIDEVLGIVTVRDLLLEKPRSLRPVLREILFVPEAQNIAHLLREMQKKNIGIAIVVDEYGGTAGLVTLEDIVEEFFGEILDEYDVEASLYRKISPRQIDVSARIEIEELNRRFDLSLKEGDYQTLGGLLLDRLGHIPQRGEKIELERCTLTVLSAFRKKVSWVRIILKIEGEVGKPQKEA